MGDSILIDRRFQGLDGFANGGYAAGAVAVLIDGPAEVTLRRPVPVGRSLQAVVLDGGGVAVRDGEAVVAEGAAAPPVDIEVPPPVTLAEAEAAGWFRVELSQRMPQADRCFTCGPARKPGDGLRIFAGPIKGRDLHAGAWLPGRSLADDAGYILPEIVWAAVDCPGAFACVGYPEEWAMLGRFAVRILHPVVAGRRYVVMAWPLGREGRKVYAGTGLFSAEGTLLAVARATWITTSPPAKATAD